MTVAKLAQTSRTQLSGAAAALNGLANSTYVVVGTVTHNASGKTPLDCLVELAITPGTVATPFLVSLFAQSSLDGTNFGTGPTSGTSATDEPDLLLIGTIAVNSNSAIQRRIFSLAGPNGGVLPYASKLIVRNTSGAALAGSGNDVYTQDITGDIT